MGVFQNRASPYKELFLSRPTTPCFVEFLLSLQFTRGQNAKKLFVRERLLRRLQKQLQILAGRAVEYGPLNRPITARVPAEGYNTVSYIRDLPHCSASRIRTFLLCSHISPRMIATAKQALMMYEKYLKTSF